MKTDTLFYQLLKEFPQIFFELIGKSEINPNTYEFIAPEVKQRSFRLDGLFLTKEEFSSQPLYFVEAQFYREEDFYDRLFPSIFLYFGQYKPLNPHWQAIIIFDRRSHDTLIPPRYQALATHHLQRIYLDELNQVELNSLGIGIVKLIVESSTQAANLAQSLINQAKNQVTDAINQQQILELIETIVIYKFPRLSRQEIEAMLNLSEIKQTKVYQEARSEGLAEGLEEGKLRQKLAMIPLLSELGLSVEQISDRIEIDRETVTRILQQQK